MKNVHTYIIIFIFYFFVASIPLLAQPPLHTEKDSMGMDYPAPDSHWLEPEPKAGFHLPNPANIQRFVEYDSLTHQYILMEKIGDRFFRPPRFLKVDEYLSYENELLNKKYWRSLSDSPMRKENSSSFIPAIRVNNKIFERIFGSRVVSIYPQGTAELQLGGKFSKNNNPMLNEQQRRLSNFDFNQTLQTSVAGKIGDKMLITTSYNTEAQFDFENQVKLDYTGKPDEIIQKIEAGNVSLPLPTTLITGSQALFGVKTQLKFGKLNVTSLFAQQRSQSKDITITNGSQQNTLKIPIANYDANKHFFLAQFFRNSYDQALSNPPLVKTNVNITKIEVYVTNRIGSTSGARDALALLDLGENSPYNRSQIKGGTSTYPAGFLGDPAFPQQSNNLLKVIPADARYTNSNAINAFFQANNGTDNYAKLSNARRLSDNEFQVNNKLGYISLNAALGPNDVLAVAYRYTVNGKEYQVGEFSTDLPQSDPLKPRCLYLKLLKNEILKTYLPTWDLMMKNIYSLGATQINNTNFTLDIFRLNENGIDEPVITEGLKTIGKLWIQLTGLDRISQQNSNKPDGFFDFLDGITIDATNGRIMFPLVEPFGSDLSKQFTASEGKLVSKYVFQPLYDSTKTIAQDLFPYLDRYSMTVTYQSQSSSEFQLNATGIPPGSVQVFAGPIPLTEGVDFVMDYMVGRIKILNQALLSSGQPLHVKLENAELLGVQERSLFGSRFDYLANDKLTLGATFMNFTVKPVSEKVSIGDEPIANIMWGIDAKYTTASRWLTKMIDKLPYMDTKAPSFITWSAEVANLIPGHPKVLNFAGSRDGTSYIDDFEGSRAVFDLKSPSNWQISSTPQLFKESQLMNDLAYGYNRARLAFYTIDPIFFQRTANSLTPPNIKNNFSELSNHYVREVLETEVFPYKQSTIGQIVTLPTFDIAFYPMTRGPYNYAFDGINSDGTLSSPKDRWGGIFRKLESPDFEALNVQYIEMWLLDPFIYKQNAQGGDLYFNLGSISEDILRSGRRFAENGLPPNGDRSQTDVTAWGRVPKSSPIIQGFDNDPAARKLQDVGLDGLSDADERVFFADFLRKLKGKLNTQAANEIYNDPSSDDYQYYRGNVLDNINAGILKRYERYNGTEGNSKTAQQSLAETGIDNTASTNLPDDDDIGRDNSFNQTDAYYQYKIPLTPAGMVVGKNFITDKVTSTVNLPNGTTQQVSWYQFKIPITDVKSYSRVGNVQDFKNMQFMRMFLTNFSDTVVLRFANLQLVSGEWRAYNTENNATKVIADTALGPNPGLDGSNLEVGTINVEENGSRSPIPYVVPPGIQRDLNYSGFSQGTYQNEQSLSLTITNLKNGYGRAAFKTAYNDFRSYRRIKMFIHAEGNQLKNKDLSAFIRIGSDYQQNYYEYNIPLTITIPGANDPNAIWPATNMLDLELSKLQQAKLARNMAIAKGTAALNKPFSYQDGVNTIVVVGQPDLSSVRAYMLGVRNPYNPNKNKSASMSGQVWFDELRLTDFDERGGWAAAARTNVKLADFADLTISGSGNTIGFGPLDAPLSGRSRNSTHAFAFASNLELGKLFPSKAGLRIPMYADYSTQVSRPQYDPRSPDIELGPTLRTLPKKLRNAIRNITNDVSTYHDFNFTNVRKVSTDSLARLYPWSLENWAASYSFRAYNHHNFIYQLSLDREHTIGLAYNFSNQPKNYRPFDKYFKSSTMALIKDINVTLAPATLSFGISIDRKYTENTLRNNDSTNAWSLPITNYRKDFQMVRNYGLAWNLTNSLKLDFSANNTSTIDEPDGPVNAANRDSIWRNLLHLGRNTYYEHALNLTYNVPIDKIPGLAWANLSASYGAHFNWRSEDLITMLSPNLKLGNTIENAQTIQLTPTLNLASLYNWFPKLRQAQEQDIGRERALLYRLLTSLKVVTATYTQSRAIFFPGYLPRTCILGYDFHKQAPGLGFLLGSQKDIRAKAVAEGWITNDTIQNELYLANFKEDINVRGTLEPIPNLKLELSSMRSRSFNYATNFRYNVYAHGFSNFSPVTTGSYSISYCALLTAFSPIRNDGGSYLFNRFERYRAVLSRRQGAQNPNSLGFKGAYADGYSKSSQHVMVSSFLAAYTGRSPYRIKLGSFPMFPVPNWNVTYDGLTTNEQVGDLFASIHLTHSYLSTYNIGNFSTLQAYQETKGSSSARNANGDFLPLYQFSQVTLLEEFSPLFGIDARLKNNVTTNFQYRKLRTLTLSLSNSEVTQQLQTDMAFGIGYFFNDFRFPFGWFNSIKLNNNLNIRADFTVSDLKTIIYRADLNNPEISSGARTITIAPMADYVINQHFNVRLFYEGKITKPYTSQFFNTSFSNFGLNLRYIM